MSGRACEMSWVAEQDCANSITIRDDSGRYVAHILAGYDASEEDENPDPDIGPTERKDAHLIAAAPELYEALLWLTNTCCDVGKDGEPVTQNEHSSAIEAAQAAIAKAEGHQ